MNVTPCPAPAERDLDYDVVVVGSGLAGLVAAAKAAAAGARVGVVSVCPGNLGLWSGLVTGEVRASGPRARAVSFFLDESEKAGLPYRRASRARSGAPAAPAATGGALTGAARKGFVLVSPSGRLVTAGLAPRTMAAGDIRSLAGSGGLLVVGFTELTDYPAALIAARAQAETGLAVGHRSLSLGPEAGRGAAMRAARLFDDRAWFSSFLRTVRKVLGAEFPGARPPAAVAFPPVLGLFRSAENLAAIETALGWRVFELPAEPPSVPGLRFWLLWRHRLESGGLVRFHIGRRVGRAGVENARCLWVGDGSYRYQARAFVLATGGVAGGGLVVGPRALFRLARGGSGDASVEGEAPFEPIFGLPTTGRKVEWSTWGVRVGRDGRAEPLANVLVAGWQLGSGGGQEEPDALSSIETGWRAGGLAATWASGRPAKGGGVE